MSNTNNPSPTIPSPIPTSGLVHKSLAEFERKKVTWLPGDRFKIPRGKLTLFVGDPGNGKSFVVTNLIAELTSTHGSRIIILSEDDPSDTIRPRLEDMHGDPKLVEIVTGVRKDQRDFGFTLSTDLVHFKKLIGEIKPDLVFIDPLVSYTGKANTFKGNEVRALLDPYVGLAVEHNFALICVIHLNKADTKSTYKISDSIQYTAIAKSIYLVGQNPDPIAETGIDTNNLVVCHLKTNLSKKSPSFSFHIEALPDNPDRAKLVWGAEVSLTSDDLVRSVVAAKVDDASTKIEIATAFLQGALRRGPQPTIELETLAVELGVKEKTLKRARKALGVESKRVGGSDGAWVSYLPGYEGAPSYGEHNTPSPVADPRLVDVLIDLGGKLDTFDENSARLLTKRGKPSTSK